jgi:hypothetical protein
VIGAAPAWVVAGAPGAGNPTVARLLLALREVGVPGRPR